MEQAFEYKRLLFDYNREVRRAAHETMTNLVRTFGSENIHLSSSYSLLKVKYSCILMLTSGILLRHNIYFLNI